MSRPRPVEIWDDLADRLPDAPGQADRLRAAGKLPRRRCHAATAHRTRCWMGASIAGLCFSHSIRARLHVRERAAQLAASA